MICRIKKRLLDPKFSSVNTDVSDKLNDLLKSGGTSISTGPAYGTGTFPNIPVTANTMKLEGLLPTPGVNSSDVLSLIGYYEQFKNYGPAGSQTDILNYGSC